MRVHSLLLYLEGRREFRSLLERKELHALGLFVEREGMLWL